MTEQQISEAADSLGKDVDELKELADETVDEIDELLGDDLENTERWLTAWADAIRKGYKTVDDFRRQYGGNRENAEAHLGQSISEEEWQSALDEVCAMLTNMAGRHRGA